jgi:TRAP-type C4-dicarboxylate transport system substrate-binding protein
MKTIITLTVILAGFFFLATRAQAVELKLATVAPEGTSLYKALATMADDVKTKTSGRVTIKIFGGGVQGDEKDVVRKMRYGQLDGAALTGVGLGLIDQEIRVLELPFLFNNEAEVDKVYAGMDDFFSKLFSGKGFQVLGWSEVGFVKIFSDKPIRNRKDLEGVKMWMWEGDPLAEEMFKEMKVTPVPLAITDVLTSLQTRLINAAYTPELGAIALQWQTKTKYMTDVNFVNGTGGLVLTNAAWAKIGAQDQAAVKAVGKVTAQALVQQTRKDNLESKTVIQGQGIQVVTLDPEALSEFKEIGKAVRQNLIGKLYSQEVLDKVVAILGQ